MSKKKKQLDRIEAKLNAICEKLDINVRTLDDSIGGGGISDPTGGNG